MFKRVKTGIGHLSEIHSRMQSAIARRGQTASAGPVASLPSKKQHRARVPKASSMSCDQVIFVDQATDAGLPSDVVPRKIDGFGRGFCGAARVGGIPREPRTQRAIIVLGVRRWQAWNHSSGPRGGR
jgi:hypothetical protein